MGVLAVLHVLEHVLRQRYEGVGCVVGGGEAGPLHHREASQFLESRGDRTVFSLQVRHRKHRLYTVNQGYLPADGPAAPAS